MKLDIHNGKAGNNNCLHRKQALCIASVASLLDNFNRNNIQILLEMGYEVTAAANFHSKEDINSQEKIDAFAKEMRAKGVHTVQIDFSRNIWKAGCQLKSALQVQKLLKQNFDLIHCHSPICAALVRAEAAKYRKTYGTRVFYTAHGFHFFSGAPKRNWLLYYPAEWLFSWVTDDLITITKEDYQRAKKHFHAKRIHALPGAGVNIEKFAPHNICRGKVRTSLCLKDSDIMLFSAGELNENKNHKAVIEALFEIKKADPLKYASLHYMIAGKGSLGNELEKLAQRLGVSAHLHLLGYRTDIPGLLAAADIFILPSKREGLNMSLMEAMASGLPCIAGRIRGNRDLLEGLENSCLVNPADHKEIAAAVISLSEKGTVMISERKPYSRLKKFSLEAVSAKMKKIYAKGGF